MKRKLDAPLIDLSSEFDRKEVQELPSSVLKNVENMDLLSSQLSPTKNAGGPSREKKKKKKSQKQIDRELETERKAKEAERKAKSQLKLSSFFKKVDKPKLAPAKELSNSNFRPFVVKQNTTLAPHNRFWRAIEMDAFLSQFDTDADTTTIIPTFKSRPPFTKPTSITPSRFTHKFKFLKFAEDVRPAYYGTFFKTSVTITPRKPLGTDTQLDYDFDSEAEWDDDPGEDLVSEEEVDDTVPNDDDDPTKSSWLVPHGYLSDDEGVEHDLKVEELKVKVVTVLVPVVVNPGGMACMPELLIEKFDEGIIDPFEVQASTFQEYRVPGDGRATKKSSIFPVELVPALEETIKQCLPEHTMGILINNFWIDNQHLTKTAIETEFKKLARKAKSDADAPTKYMLRADIEQLKSRQSSREGGADVNYFESDEEDEVEFIKKIGGVEAIIVPVKDSVDVDVNGVGVTASVADDSIVDGIMDVHVAAAVNTDKVIALENEVVEITVDLGESACSHFKENQEIEKVHRSIEPKLEPEIIVSDQEMQVGSNFKDSAVISDEDVMEIPPPAISIEEVIIQPPTVAPLFSEIGGKISSNLDTDVVMDIGVINPSEAACKEQGDVEMVLDLQARP